MPRLIDADEALRIAASYEGKEDQNGDAALCGCGLRMIEKIIQETPTVDAVKVVRCKDCVLHGRCIIESAFNADLYENPYCALGKRLEDMQL